MAIHGLQSVAVIKHNAVTVNAKPIRPDNPAIVGGGYVHMLRARYIET